MNIKELANKLETQVQTENNKFCKCNNILDCQYFVTLNNRSPKIHGMLVILGYYARNPNESKDLIQNKAVLLATAMEFYLTALIIDSRIVHYNRREQEQIYSNKEYQYDTEERVQRIEVLTLKTIGLRYALKLLFDHYEWYGSDIVNYFLEIINNTLHGKALDILVPRCKISNEYEHIDSELREIKRKIESFLFEASFYMGYRLGGNIDGSEVQWFKEFGRNLASICQFKVEVSLLQKEYPLNDLHIYQGANNINSFNKLLNSFDYGPLSNRGEMVKEYLRLNIYETFLKNG